MGPIIILDKSSLQSLSKDEILVLNKYYMVNIVPVLAMEILADLKKGDDTDEARKKTVILSNKLLSSSLTVNTNFKDLIESSLMGHTVGMDGRPVLSGGQPVQTEDGRKGFIFKESLEEKAIMRWHENDFSKAEMFLADKWRETSKSIDLVEFKKELKKLNKNTPKLDSLEEVNNFIDKLLDDFGQQRKLLELIICEFKLENKNTPIFYNWTLNGELKIKDYAPYAYYCFKISIFFNLALMNDLITERSTNRIDLQYLYYLPHCYVFSSGDNLHRSLVPFFLRSDQLFVDGNDLKKDLASIVSRRGFLDKKELADWDDKYHLTPPDDNPCSLTLNLWKGFMAYDRVKGRKSKKKASKRIKKSHQEHLMKL